MRKNGMFSTTAALAVAVVCVRAGVIFAAERQPCAFAPDNADSNRSRYASELADSIKRADLALPPLSAPASWESVDSYIQKVSPFFTPEERLRVIKELQSGGNSGPILKKDSSLPTEEQVRSNAASQGDRSCLWAFSYNFLDSIKTQDRQYGKAPFNYDASGGAASVMKLAPEVRTDVDTSGYEMEELGALIEKYGLAGSLGGARISDAEFARLMRVNGIIDELRKPEKPSFGLPLSGLSTTAGKDPALANFIVSPTTAEGFYKYVSTKYSGDNLTPQETARVVAYGMKFGYVAKECTDAEISKGVCDKEAVERLKDAAARKADKSLPTLGSNQPPLPKLDMSDPKFRVLPPRRPHFPGDPPVKPQSPDSPDAAKPEEQQQQDSANPSQEIAQRPDAQSQPETQAQANGEYPRDYDGPLNNDHYDRRYDPYDPNFERGRRGGREDKESKWPSDSNDKKSPSGGPGSGSEGEDSPGGSPGGGPGGGDSPGGGPGGGGGQGGGKAEGMDASGINKPGVDQKMMDRMANILGGGKGGPGGEGGASPGGSAGALMGALGQAGNQDFPGFGGFGAPAPVREVASAQGVPSYGALGGSMPKFASPPAAAAASPAAAAAPAAGGAESKKDRGWLFKNSDFGFDDEDQGYSPRGGSSSPFGSYGGGSFGGGFSGGFRNSGGFQSGGAPQDDSFWTPDNSDVSSWENTNDQKQPKDKNSRWASEDPTETPSGSGRESGGNAAYLGGPEIRSAASSAAGYGAGMDAAAGSGGSKTLSLDAEYYADYYSALAAANAALMSNPEDIKALLKRANAYYGLTRYISAAADAVKAAELDAANTSAYLLLSKCLLQMNRPQDSLASAFRAISLDANMPEAYAVHGAAAERLGNYSQMLDDLRKASDMDEEGYGSKFQDAIAAYGDKAPEFLLYSKNRGAVSGKAVKLLNRYPGGVKAVAALAGLALTGTLLGLTLRKAGSVKLVRPQAEPEPPCEPVAAGPLPEVAGCAALRLVSAGGSGMVYEGKDASGGRVAMKKFDEDIAPETKTALVERLNLVAQLHSANIPEVFYAGEQDGAVWLLTRFVEGGQSLESRLARGGPLPLDEAKKAFAGVAAALDTLHGAGLLHGHMHLADIRLDGMGEGVLTDAGVGAVLERDDTDRTAAPEGAPGKPADIYSFAVCLYESLTGKIPGEGPLEPASKVFPDLPAETDAVLAIAMSGDPNVRYPSASALLADLDNLTRNKPAPSDDKPADGSASAAVSGDTVSEEEEG